MRISSFAVVLADRILVTLSAYLYGDAGCESTSLRRVEQVV